MIAFLPMLPYTRFYIHSLLYRIILVSLIVVTITGCGGKVILSGDAVRIRKINDFADELRGLYEQRDEHVLDLFSPEYLAEAREIRGAILQDMGRFSGISLSLFIDRIEINKNNANISIHWNGMWKDAHKTYREGGSMVLLTSDGDSIRITGIKGDSPFGISRMFNRNEN